MVEQGSHQLAVALAGGRVQGGVSAPVGSVRAGASCQQEPRGRRLADAGRHVQRRAAAAVARVRVGAGIEEDVDAVGQAASVGGDGGVQRASLAASEGDGRLDELGVGVDRVPLHETAQCCWVRLLHGGRQKTAQSWMTRVSRTTSGGVDDVRRTRRG